MYGVGDLHVTPADLAAFAWSAPMRDLAVKAGMSDVGLKKLLRGLGVVTPPQGHWNRVKAGRMVPGPPAPAPRGPGDSGRIMLDGRFRGLVSDAGGWPVHGPFATAGVPESLDDLRATVLARTPEVKIPRLATKTHRGIAHLLGREEKRVGYAARGWPAEAPSFATPFWKRQVRLLNALFLALDRHGAAGVADATEGQLGATVKVGDTAVALALAPAGKVRRERYAGYDRPASDLPATTPLRLRISWPAAQGSWEDGPGQPIERCLRAVIADVITAGEAGFRQRLREHRDWLAQVAASREAERQRRLAAEEATRAVRLSEQAAALRAADDIRALVARVRGAGGETIDPAARESWCAWALARADRLDPLVSGALVSGFGLAGIEPGST